MQALKLTIQLAAHEQSLKTTSFTIKAPIQWEAHIGVYSSYFNIILVLLDGLVRYIPYSAKFLRHLYFVEWPLKALICVAQCWWNECLPEARPLIFARYSRWRTQFRVGLLTHEIRKPLENLALYGYHGWDGCINLHEHNYGYISLDGCINV